MGVDKAITTNNVSVAPPRPHARAVVLTTNTVQPLTYPKGDKVNVVKGEPIIMGAVLKSQVAPVKEGGNTAPAPSHKKAGRKKEGRS